MTHQPDQGPPIPGAGWRGVNIIPTPPPSWPPLFYFGANNPPHPSLLKNANAFWGAGLGTGKVFVYDERRPMLRQLDYQWAGTYKQKLWDPLPFYRGYSAAPVLTQARQGMYWRAQPTHDGLGYQMVLLRDDGVPVGGEPASTPRYVFAGPTQMGYMDFVRPIVRAEELPRIQPPIDRIWRTQREAMYGPYGGGPFSRPPLQPQGFATMEDGLGDFWPTYQTRPVAPPQLPPPMSSTPEMANTNPGMPPRRKDSTMIATWRSPNDIARETIRNPMIGSGPGYHGYLNTAMNGMGAGAGPSYASMSARRNPWVSGAPQPMMAHVDCGWTPGPGSVVYCTGGGVTIKCDPQTLECTILEAGTTGIVKMRLPRDPAQMRAAVEAEVRRRVALRRSNPGCIDIPAELRARGQNPTEICYSAATGRLVASGNYAKYDGLKVKTLFMSNTHATVWGPGLPQPLYVLRCPHVGPEKFGTLKKTMPNPGDIVRVRVTPPTAMSRARDLVGRIFGAGSRPTAGARWDARSGRWVKNPGESLVHIESVPPDTGRYKSTRGPAARTANAAIVIASRRRRGTKPPEWSCLKGLDTWVCTHIASGVKDFIPIDPTKGPNPHIEYEFARSRTAGVVPLGVYSQWSGFRHRGTIAKAVNPGACCDHCALEDGRTGNPCPCNGG